jgi:hypothetical protein
MHNFFKLLDSGTGYTKSPVSGSPIVMFKSIQLARARLPRKTIEEERCLEERWRT